MDKIRHRDIFDKTLEGCTVGTLMKYEQSEIFC